MMFIPKNQEDKDHEIPFIWRRSDENFMPLTKILRQETSKGKLGADFVLEFFGSLSFPLILLSSFIQAICSFPIFASRFPFERKSAVDKMLPWERIFLGKFVLSLVPLRTSTDARGWSLEVCQLLMIFILKQSKGKIFHTRMLQASAMWNVVIRSF